MRFYHAEVISFPLALGLLAFALWPRSELPALPADPPVIAIAEPALPAPPPACEPPPPAPSPIMVDELTFDARQLTSEMPFKGTLVKGARWTDRAGENFALFSSSGSTHFYVSHHVRDASGVRLVRTVKDVDPACTDGDRLASGFHHEHLVTDLDHDGIGELTFGYFHDSCTTDMSPAQFKLFLLEGGDKHVLRGGGYMSNTRDQPAVPRRSADIPTAFTRHLDRWWFWMSNQSISFF